MMRWTVMLLVLGLLTGCRRELDQKLTALEREQVELGERIVALENESRELGALVAQQSAAKPSSPTGTVSALPPGLADALADQIGEMLTKQVAYSVEQELARRIGSADDIEAIFTDAVDEGFREREEQERREKEVQREVQITERYHREVNRRADTIGFDADQREAVANAVDVMRARLKERLPMLEYEGASLEKKLAAVAEVRKEIDTHLLQTLSQEEIDAYYAADPWYQRHTQRVSEIAEIASLDEAQTEQVKEAYTTMRDTIGNAFILRSEGYLERDDIRDAFQSSRSVRDTSLESIMSPPQFEAYKSSDANSSRGFGRMFGF
jgi:hypothetical protein